MTGSKCNPEADDEVRKAMARASIVTRGGCMNCSVACLFRPSESAPRAPKVFLPMYWRAWDVEEQSERMASAKPSDPRLHSCIGQFESGSLSRIRDSQSIRERGVMRRFLKQASWEASMTCSR